MASVEKISSVFFSSGEEGLPIIDVFNDKDLSIKNALVSNVDGLSNGSIRSIMNDQSLLTRVTGILITKDLGNFSLDSSAISSIVGNTDIGAKLKGLTSGLSDTFKGGIESAFRAINIDPKTALGAISVIGGEVTHLAQTAVGYGTDTGSFLNKAVSSLGVGKLINLDWEHAVLSGSMEDMLYYGGGDIIDTLVDNFRSDYDANDLGYLADMIIKKAVKNNIQNVVSTGKLKNIKKFLQKLDVGEAVNRYPDIAKDILANYQIPKKTKVKKYIDQLTLMVEVLNMADPDWFKSKSIFSEYVATTVDGEEVVNIVTRTAERYNLFTFLACSRDAETILRIDPDRTYEMQLTIAPSFPDRSTETMAILKSNFKFVVLDSELEAA